MYIHHSARLIRGLFSFIVLINVVFLASCDNTDDPEVLDTNKPTLSFVSPAANAILKNSITAQVEALDDDGVTHVEIFVDDVSLKSFDTPPYTVDWNTKTVADGAHIIKAIASDKAGNVETVEVSVVVQNTNTLLTIDVPADFYETGLAFKTWVVLHDKDWNIITAGKVRAGKRLNLIAPSDFTDEKFTVTEIAIFEEGLGAPFVYAACYLEVDKGMWVVAKDFNMGRNLKSINLSFINPDGVTEYSASTNAGLYTQLSKTTAYTGKTAERSVFTTLTPSKLFMRETTKTNNKFFMNSTAHIAGNSYVQDLASVTNAGADNILQKETFTLQLPEDPMYIEVSLYGLPVQNKFDEAYLIGKFGPVGNTLTVEYPKASTNTFAGYFAQTYMVADKFMAINIGTEKYDITTLPLKASLNVLSPTTSRLTASGQFDLFSASYFSDNGTVANTFTIMGPAVIDQEIKMPHLPDSVTADMSFVALSEMAFSESVGFSDVTGVDGYFDLVSKTKREQAGFFPGGVIPQRSLYLQEHTYDHSGRKANASTYESLRAELSTLQLGLGILQGPFRRGN